MYYLSRGLMQYLTSIMQTPLASSKNLCSDKQKVQRVYIWFDVQLTMLTLIVSIVMHFSFQISSLTEQLESMVSMDVH